MWTAGVVSEGGDAVGRIALTVLVQQETGSAFLTGSVVALYTLPFLGPGQWLTARLAHRPRRRVLIAADVLRAVLFAAMVLPVGILPRLALLLAASLATPPFNAISSAVIARSVPTPVIGRAAALRTGSTELAFIVGFAVGGLAAELTSPEWVIGFDALTFLASAAIIARTHLPDPEPAEVRPVAAGEGVRVIVEDPLCRRAMLLVTVTFALVLVPETLVATYSDEVLPDRSVAGPLAALTAVGVVLATLLRRPDDDVGVVRNASLLALGGAGVAAAAFLGPDTLLLAGIAYLATGPVLAIRVHAYTVLSKRIDDLRLAPAMSVAGGAIAASYLVAGLAGGVAADAIGIDSTAAIAAAIAAAVAALSLVVPLRARVSRPARG